jgi:4-hydroxy-3-polyprenylbenzoate decarboxylase
MCANRVRGNQDYTKYPFTLYHKNDFNAPFASGSAQYNIHVGQFPAAWETLGRIASGVSDCVSGPGAADVILKERRTDINST